MKFFRLLYLFFLIGGVAGTLQSQNRAAGTSQRIPGPRRIIVTTQSGATISGNLMRLDPDKLEIISAHGLRIISVDEIKSIAFDHTPENEPEPPDGNSATEATAHTSQPQAPRVAPTPLPASKPALLSQEGTQNPPRGYTKPRDRPSRRGAREAARKLEEINRQREPQETENNDATTSAPNGAPAVSPERDTSRDEDEAAAAARAETERLERERAKRLAREQAARERATRERNERLARERREKSERERQEREARAERERKERATRERNNKKDKERDKDKKTAKTKTKEKEVASKPAPKTEPARKKRKG